MYPFVRSDAERAQRRGGPSRAEPGSEIDTPHDKPGMLPLKVVPLPRMNRQPASRRIDSEQSGAMRKRRERILIQYGRHERSAGRQAVHAHCRRHVATRRAKWRPSAVQPGLPRRRTHRPGCRASASRAQPDGTVGPAGSKSPPMSPDCTACHRRRPASAPARHTFSRFAIRQAQAVRQDGHCRRATSLRAAAHRADPAQAVGRRRRRVRPKRPTPTDGRLRHRRLS